MDVPEALPQDPLNVRKKSWSNRLEDFCCLYDINSKWYEFKGKGKNYYLLIFSLIIKIAISDVTPLMSVEGLKRLLETSPTQLMVVKEDVSNSFFCKSSWEHTEKSQKGEYISDHFSSEFKNFHSVLLSV